MFGDDRPLFDRYARVGEKAIFPWPLNIVDCFFLNKAFMQASPGCGDICFRRVYGNSLEEDAVVISSAYDLYKIDRETHGFEVALIDENSGFYCYWDLYERFVIAAGDEKFLSIARPYPEDVERHRYIESMLGIDGWGEGQSPEDVYNELVSFNKKLQNWNRKPES